MRRVLFPAAHPHGSLLRCVLSRFLAASLQHRTLQILESSQTLLAVLKREAVSLSKRSAAPL